MRLISLIFILSLSIGFINCTNQSDQSKSAANDDKSTAQIAATNSNQPAQPQVTGPAGPETLKLESRQIGSSPHHYNQDAQASNINIYSTNISPKDTAHQNPNAPIGYIKIQPYLAPLSSHQTPESQGSTTFLSFIKPKHYEGSRRSFSLTSKLKNLMSSLFWKDNPMMTSGSSYSFSFKPPPSFNTMNGFQNQMQPNYASNLVSASSQYKPVVQFPNYQASNNNFNKYTSSFNGPQFAGSGNTANSNAAYPAPYYSSNQNNAAYNSNPSNQNYLRNNKMVERNVYSSSSPHTGFGFPPSSYQVAYQSDGQALSSSNNMNTYSSPSANQYSNNNNNNINNNNINNNQDTNASNNFSNQNQRSAVTEHSSPVNSKTVYNPTDSSSSASSNLLQEKVHSLPLTNNPVSLIKTNKQQFTY